MMIGREGRKSLGDEIVASVTGFHFNHVALLAEGIDGLNEKELDSTVGSLGQTLAGTISVASLFISNLHYYTLFFMIYQFFK